MEEENKDIVTQEIETLKVEASADSNTGAEEQPLQSEQVKPYFSETHKKEKDRRHTNILQLAIVAILCSMLGGGLVYGALQLFPDAGQPQDSGNDSGSFFQDPYVASTAIDDYDADDVGQVTAIAEKVSPSVVAVNTYVKVRDFFLGNTEQSGSGSGIIIKPDGYIITNNHVIAGALDFNSNVLSDGSRIEVVLPGQKDKPYIAKVIGRDEKTDIAVIKIEAENLPTAELGDSDVIRIGELAVAIGNPGGMTLMGTVTSGIISGLDRTLEIDNGRQMTLIQTDAAINPGNSGGALCNSKGQVIGINTIKIAAQNFEGLGFAIPINTAKEIAGNLVESGYVKGRPYLGIQIDSTFNEQLAKKYDVPVGLRIYDVMPMSPASSAGLKTDDIITKFNGVSVKTFSELDVEKNKHKPGDEVDIEIYRYSEKSYMTFKLKLAEDTGSQ